ncbi:MAG: malonate-semialdehyde dehydrogenase (acetylating) / methylmalonate-semialdehyde dehydrogenase [Actinomycetota bacterium]|jgi:malonate-semialdehyde dehydrogenase (acetylating)/methylmalonate-semialdehyde dehydrogenase|nr:malonate-semialdehyde dehydrogenase (acetylating) / methylmalonate-semialdehyde dehydrogenase [Actinomycetota bacterium]
MDLARDSSIDQANTVPHRIGGAASLQTPERVGDVYDPATGRIAKQVAFASPPDVDRAVSAARAAFPMWRDLPLARRTRIIFAFRELLQQRKEDLARLITAEHGKVLSDAMGEVERGAEVVDFACGLPHLLKGEFSENVSTGIDTYSIRQPLGVVAGITPFNFPAMVPMWMFPIAIACGNTFILKPSEKDPSAPNMLVELFEEAGLPPGVMNVVHGDKVAVDSLLLHPDVAAVSSVGSTPVARYIYETAAAAGKRVQALGGAKNHMVVMPDADMDATADAVVGSAYGSAGERCMAISAVVAVGPAGDSLMEAVKPRIEALHVAAGTAEGAEMGPLVTGAHRDKVVSFVEAGVAEGAALILDGRDKTSGSEGFFLGPCLFDHVEPSMSIYREEIFGPVLSVVRVETFEEAVALVNSNPYGNGTAIFTSSGAAARAFQREIEVGMVGINVPIPVPMAFYSFGGWKSSLFGDAHVHGMDGVRFYTRSKVVTSRWPAPPPGSQLGFPTN